MIICFFYICVSLGYIPAWWNWRNKIKNEILGISHGWVKRNYNERKPARIYLRIWGQEGCKKGHGGNFALVLEISLGDCTWEVVMAAHACKPVFTLDSATTLDDNCGAIKLVGAPRGAHRWLHSTHN